MKPHEIYAKQLNKFGKESILTPLAVLALNNCGRSVVLLYLPRVLENCLAIYQLIEHSLLLCGFLKSSL